jgi:hypothetical protein
MIARMFLFNLVMMFLERYARRLQERSALKFPERFPRKSRRKGQGQEAFLPSGCDTPYFKSHELVGTKGAKFRQRLGEQKEQFTLTDRELVNPKI